MLKIEIDVYENMKPYREYGRKDERWSGAQYDELWL